MATQPKKPLIKAEYGTDVTLARRHGLILDERQSGN
jgi:hypothetical protein